MLYLHHFVTPVHSFSPPVLCRLAYAIAVQLTVSRSLLRAAPRCLSRAARHPCAPHHAAHRVRALSSPFVCAMSHSAPRVSRRATRSASITPRLTPRTAAVCTVSRCAPCAPPPPHSPLPGPSAAVCTVSRCAPRVRAKQRGLVHRITQCAACRVQGHASPGIPSCASHAVRRVSRCTAARPCAPCHAACRAACLNRAVA